MDNSEFKIENNILKGREFPCADLKYSSVGEMILAKLRSDPDFVGQIDGITGEQHTFEKMRDRSVRCALWMKKQGLLPRDVVAICSHNQLDVVMPYFAALYLGVTCIPLYDGTSAEELCHIMTLVRPKIAFVNEASAASFAEEAKEVNLDLKIVVLGQASTFFTFETIIAEPGIDEVRNYRCTQIVNPDVTAMIMCTSGTSAFPKGVALTDASILKYLRRDGIKQLYHGTVTFSRLASISGRDVVFVSVSEKSTIIVLPAFEEYAACELIEKFQIQSIFLTPTMINRLLKSHALSNYDLSSIKSVMTGETNLSVASQEAFIKKFPNARITTCYSMTELGGGVTSQSNSSKPGSCGRILTNCQLKIVDPDTGRVLGTNQAGELLWKSDTMITCYYNDPDATAATIDGEGWLHSGDLGYYDEDGEIFVVDRLKELIKYRDEDIYPFQVESVLLSHPGVKEVAVVGMPHPLDDQHPIAFVVTTESSLTEKKVTEQELIDLVATKLDDSKQLRGGVKFMNNLPKTASNKIRRKYLRELARSMATK